MRTIYRHTLSSIKLIIKRKLNEIDPPGTENGGGRVVDITWTHSVV